MQPFSDGTTTFENLTTAMRNGMKMWKTEHLYLKYDSLKIFLSEIHVKEENLQFHFIYRFKIPQANGF